MLAMRGNGAERNAAQWPRPVTRETHAAKARARSVALGGFAARWVHCLVPRTAYDAIRAFLALVLLAAGGLKAHHLATSAMAGVDFVAPRWLLMGVVEFELLFGLWLLAEIWPKPTWLACGACFSGFALVALVKALHGEISCGCFGRVAVNPWYTLTFDVAVIATLCVYRPQSREPQARLAHAGFACPRRIFLVLGGWLILGIPTAVAMMRFQDGQVRDLGEVFQNGKLVLLKPHTWMGKRFPLLPFVGTGDRLVTGRWIVVLYHHDCPNCREAIPNYEKLARDTQGDPSVSRVALVEMPPYDVNGKGLAADDSPCLRERLDASREWFVRTPVEIALEDGVVTRVSTE